MISNSRINWIAGENRHSVGVINRVFSNYKTQHSYYSFQTNTKHIINDMIMYLDL
jgi:hypothetical protein